MANGSCLWSDEAAAPGLVTVGACAAPQGAWSWNGSTTRGDIVHTASASCLTVAKGGQVALGPCGSAPWTQIPAGDGNASHVYLSAADGAGCIVAVPDNNNNTLGVAVGVLDASGTLVSGAVGRVSPTNPFEGITLSLSFASGAEYTLLVGLQTLRDIGCAGIRPQWETCTTPPEAAAASLVQAMAGPAALQAEVQASDAFWASYWSASSVDLTSASPPNIAAQSSTVERWYFLSQYLLACTTRDGKVTSSLDGFVCVEPVPWCVRQLGAPLVCSPPHTHSNFPAQVFLLSLPHLPLSLTPQGRPVHTRLQLGSHVLGSGLVEPPRLHPPCDGLDDQSWRRGHGAPPRPEPGHVGREPGLARLRRALDAGRGVHA
jgi:hypothetical protein